MNFSRNRIIATLLAIMMVCQFAVAREYSLSAAKLKSMKVDVVKSIDAFNVSLGKVYKSATAPGTSKSTYVELNPGNYLSFSSELKIKSISILCGDGSPKELYINDEKPDLVQLKTNLYRWDSPDSCGVNDVKFTYCCKSTDSKAEKSAKAVQLKEFTIEYFDDVTLAKSLTDAACDLCILSGDDLVGVKQLVDNANNNAVYTLVKDATGNSIAESTQEGGEPYVIDVKTGRRQENYDQSNWIIVASTANIAGRPIKSLIGRYDKANPYLFNAFSVDMENCEEGYTPNVYCPVNFMGNSLQAGADGKNYFFMAPKMYEYANIVYAVYAGDNKFYTPKRVGNGVNKLDFSGGFEVSYRFNVEADPDLQVGGAYEFEAVILPLAESEAQFVTFEPNTDQGISEIYLVCPLNLSSNTLPTSIDATMTGNKEVSSVTYYNLAGVSASTPFSGVNIVRTQFTDGTRKVTKLHF